MNPVREGGKRGKWGGKLALVQSLEIQEDEGGRNGLDVPDSPTFAVAYVCVCVRLNGAPLGGWV